jgi:hypothetical protein
MVKLTLDPPDAINKDQAPQINLDQAQNILAKQVRSSNVRTQANSTNHFG